MATYKLGSCSVLITKVLNENKLIGQAAPSCLQRWHTGELRGSEHICICTSSAIAENARQGCRMTNVFLPILYFHFVCTFVGSHIHSMC